MLENKVKFALIGCGRVANRHAEALMASENSQLVAVCDLKSDRAKELGNKLSVPFYTNYHEMFEMHPDIEVANIITPSGMHFEHASEVISLHKKHVVIEKPFVMTPEQGQALKLLADQHGVGIYPVFQNRFNRAVQKVKAGIADGGELGKLRIGTIRMRWCRPQRYYDLSEWRGKWSMDGGALTNQGIHMVDLVRYLCGDIKRVVAATATLGTTIEVEDTAVATLEFESGALGTLEIITSARPDNFEASISCVCEKGLAVIAGIASNEIQTYSPNPSVKESHSEVFPTVYGFGHNTIMREVAHSVRTGERAPIEFDDGFQTIRLLHAIYKSAETGKWVNLNDSHSVTSSKLGQPDERLANLYRTPKLAGTK